MNSVLKRFELVCGVILLGLIVFLVFIAAIMRTFGHPLVWSVDLAQLLFIWLCFVGASRALRARAHLGMDIAIRHLGHRSRLIIELLLAVLFIAFLAILTVEGVNLTLLNRERLFGDSGLSYAYVTIAVPFGSLLLVTSIVSNALEAWKQRNAPAADLVFSRSDDSSAQALL